MLGSEKKALAVTYMKGFLSGMAEELCYPPGLCCNFSKGLHTYKCTLSDIVYHFSVCLFISFSVSTSSLHKEKTCTKLRVSLKATATYNFI